MEGANQRVRGGRRSLQLTAQSEALLRAHAQRRVFRNGARVVARGQEAPGLWCVVSGALAVVGRDRSGNAFTLTFRQPGEWFGETPLLDQRPLQAAHHAAGRSVLLHVPHRDAKALVAGHPKLRDDLIRITCTRLRECTRHLEFTFVSDLQARLAYQLLFLADTSETGLVVGQPLAVRLPQTVLASLVGATREAVGRHLVRWRKAGWIGIRYGRISILAPAALRAVAKDELGRERGPHASRRALPG
jgi:CRP/FNR family cyclic AMP-dependent transcriptional regulator